MSSLIVKCVPIKEVHPHPNADKLVLTKVMGWQVCETKDTNPQPGDLRIFIPPDSVLPQELADKLGVTRYLRKGNRVGQVRLRGEMSFGLAVPNTWDFQENQDVAELLGITKWTPPEEVRSGDQEKDHPLFARYSDIENFRNFPDLLTAGERVLAFEKIHGTNSRVGLTYEEDGSELWLVGSHNTRKRLGTGSIYEKPLEPLKQVMRSIAAFESARVVIVYSEIFGNKIQDLNYGYMHETSWRVFDIYVDGEYLDWERASMYLDACRIPVVPSIYDGPFNEEVLWGLAKGNTLLMDEDPHVREGVVIRPFKEKRRAKERVILKMINDDYLLRKGGTERH